MEVKLHLSARGATPQEAIGNLKHRASELDVSNWLNDSTVEVRISSWKRYGGDEITPEWGAATVVSIADDSYLMRTENLQEVG